MADTVADELLSNALPRSQMLVDQLAKPCIEREKKARRIFRIGAVVLLALTIGLPLVTGGDMAALSGVGAASFLAIWLVLWFALSRANGYAANMVQTGIAHRARIDVQHGGARASTVYYASWIDSNGLEHRRSVGPPPVTASAQPPQEEAVVLTLPGSNRIGIVVGGYLSVL